MSARWSAGGVATAFRAEPAPGPTARPSARQSSALLAVLVLVAAAVAAASYLIRPDQARSFDLLHGSLFLTDQVAPVGVDLASGKPTLRLVGADKQVGAKRPSDLALVGVEGGTVMFDRTTGEFNMVDDTGFVIKHDGGGVRLPRRNDETTSSAFAPGGGIEAGVPGAAYILRTGPAGTNVLLVNRSNVETASRGVGTVRPTASLTTKDVASADSGAAAGADGALWVLFGSGPRHTIRQLSVPPNSNAGSGLASAERGTVEGPAAIASSTGGSGATAVAVASAGAIRYFPAAGEGSSRQDARTVALRTPAGVDSILPVSNAQGRLPFLLHAAGGWSVVSIAADGTDLRGPHLITGIPADARLAPPVWSGGALYTVDRAPQGTGQIYRIAAGGGGATPIAGAATYPLASRGGQVAESADFGDAYVVAEGSRVIVNSPGHADAVVLFTDGSRRPLIIQKGSAVDVSAAGGAEALTRDNLNPSDENGKRPKDGGAVSKPASQQINNKVDCTRVEQKPHIPVLGTPVPGSRSVGLTWTYPTLDPQDCVPSTYVVSVTALSADAPAPGGSATVQGQTSANITGLYPQTQYEVTVAAYLHGQGTVSRPIRVTTGPEGPAAPTNLLVRTDAAGNWNVSWDGCVDVRAGCVAVSSWRVIPSFCDGRGLSGAPKPFEVSADPSADRQPPAVYRGGDALLGRGLQFVVEGTGDAGQIGTPSARSACAYSHSPPIAGAMRLSASQPADTAFGSPSSTNVTLDLGGNPVLNAGGVGATVMFTLTGDGSTQTRGPIEFDGRQSKLSASFGDVRAGVAYSVGAIVQPGHGGGGVSLGPVRVSTRANWPATALKGNCAPSGLTCELTVAINGVSSADARGEHFDFDGTLRCGGGPAHSILARDFSLPATLYGGTVSQLDQFFGTCQLSGELSENASAPDPKVFGGTLTHPADDASVELGAPATSGAGASDFSARWDGSGSGAEITYSGPNAALLPVLTRSWSETVLSPSGAECGTGNDVPGLNPVTVQASAACVGREGAQSGWQVQISYSDTITGTAHGPFTVSLPGPPPGYQPCAPRGFQAAWGQTLSDGVTVTYAGDAGQLSGCTGFSYELLKDGARCGTPDQDPAPPAAAAIHPTCDATSAGSWTVHVSWRNASTGKQDAADLQLGAPPAN